MTKILLISGTRSGCGKTSLTLGLLAALRRRGLAVAPFKAGPDFIDPGLHALAAGRESLNLDTWMLSPQANREIFARQAAEADMAVVEGAMGLFDGADADAGLGSAAHLAKVLGAPVLLVADASGMGQSAAALVSGFARFDPELSLAGVAFNRVGGPGHRDILIQAAARAGTRLLGLLPKAPDLAMPARHLGLVTAQDQQGIEQAIQRLADWVEQGMDLDALLAALPDRTLRAPADTPTVDASVPGDGPLLGVARDRAFCFLYADNLRLLEQAGARIVFVSPLEDPGLPPGLDGLYLPGGYPELHAGALSANAAMLADVRAFCASGRPVYAECGGFMYLCEALEDGRGGRWPMAGVFACAAVMGQRFAALGYREARLTADTPLGPAGSVARGHEFHYSRLDVPPVGSTAYALSGRSGPLPGPEGFLRGNTLGSYVHLHFASNPALAAHFVGAMR